MSGHRPPRDRSVVARHGVLVGGRRTVVLTGGDAIAGPLIRQPIGQRRLEIFERVLHVLRQRLPPCVVLLERLGAGCRAAELVAFGRAVVAVAAVLAAIAAATGAAILASLSGVLAVLPALATLSALAGVLSAVLAAAFGAAWLAAVASARLMCRLAIAFGSI